jgi:hypothetical protein
MYLPGDVKSAQGSTVFIAKNPDFGAIFTYYLKDVPKTKKEIRQEKEKELFKKGEPIPQPSEEDLRAEKNEIAPYLTFTITDDAGNNARLLRRVKQTQSKKIIAASLYAAHKGCISPRRSSHWMRSSRNPC